MHINHLLNESEKKKKKISRRKNTAIGSLESWYTSKWPGQARARGRTPLPPKKGSNKHQENAGKGSQGVGLD